VIIVTAKGEEMARVKAVLRRTLMPELRNDKGVVRGRGFMVDLAGRACCWRAGSESDPH
jgi:Fe-S cluster biogenesis protein NfuA